jgi:predicted nucleic acid-binding Zn ribbon protein
MKSSLPPSPDSDRPVRHGPKRLGEILPQLMARRGYARQISCQDYHDAWGEVAGNLAQFSQPGLLQRGILQIHVSNSAALQELTFQKRQLLRALEERLPEQKIRDLRFVAGSIG